jgi:hypothetical protein
MDLSEAISDQRALGERRATTWRTIFFGFMRSRRHNHRREIDADAYFIDWHHPWLFFLAVGTMLMSCVDAFMTLELLQRGMVEANPVMAVMLGHSTTAFAVSKMFMTGTSLLLLVYVARARFMNRFRTGMLLTVIFSLYACLVCYEFVYLLRDM